MEQGGVWVEVVSHAAVAAEMLAAGYVLYRFFRPFSENIRGALAAGGTYSAVMLVLYILPRTFSRFPAYGMGILAALAVFCQSDRRRYGQKVFLAAVFFSLRWLTWAAAEILYDKLYHLAEETRFMLARPDLWLPLYAVMCLFYVAAGTLFTGAAVWSISRAYANKYSDMAVRELLVMSSPAFVGVVGYMVMWYYRSFYIRSTGEMPEFYDVLTLLYCLAAVAAMAGSVVLYERIRAGQDERLRNELLAAQLDSIRGHIAQVEELYQDIRGIRHDMTNHILTLESLYQTDRREEAEHYGRELKSGLSAMLGEIGSGNPVTDVILQGIKTESEKRGIRFESAFHYPGDSALNAFDVSVILHNALQNALENVPIPGQGTEEPYIAIRSYRRRNAFMIEVRNSFEGNLQWDVETGLPATAKERAEGHGYGLINIRKVSGRYFGDIDVDASGGEFRLSVMLMLE